MTAPTSPSPAPAAAPPLPAAIDRAATMLLADIESLLGRRPDHSIALRVRRRRRPYAVLRLDLPPTVGRRGEGREAPDDRTVAMASSITGMLTRLSGVGSIDIVAYGAAAPSASKADSPPGEEERSRLASVVATVASAADAAGFSVASGWCVAGGFAARADADRLRSPRSWQPLGESPPGAPEPAAPSPSADVANATEADRSDAGGDPHRGVFVPVPTADGERRARALATLAAVDSDRRAAPEQPAAVEAIDRLLEWRTLLQPGAPVPSEARAVALAWSLRNPLVRDSVVMLCAWGFDGGINALCEALGVPTDPVGVFATIIGSGTEAPDPKRLRAAVDLLRWIVECSPETLRPAPFTMLAWLEWTRGRGSVSSCYLQEALAADPHYSLALLVSEVVESGTVPDWIS